MKDGKGSVFNSLTDLQEANVDLVSELSHETAKSKLRKAKRAKKQLEKQAKSKNKGKKSSIVSIKSRASSGSSQISISSIPMTIVDVVPVDILPSPVVEQYTRGTVKCKVYWVYLKAGAGVILGTLTLLANIASQIFFTSNDLFLSKWTDQASGSREMTYRNNIMMESLWSYVPYSFYSLPIVDFDYAGYYRTNEPIETNIGIYSALIAGLFVTTVLRSTLLIRICNNASINLHNEIFHRILRSPMSLFETNPIGLIILI